MRAKLKEVRAELMRRRHLPVPESRGNGWQASCEGTPPTTPCRRTCLPLRRSALEVVTPRGIGRCRVEARRHRIPWVQHGALSGPLDPPCPSSSPLARTAISTSVPKAGAQCVSSARWDLRGGRSEPHWPNGLTGEGPSLPQTFSLGFLERHEDVIFLGPVGVGKTFLACALGHAACRAGSQVLFLRADRMFQWLHQSRADHSTEKALRRLLAPDLLILDDFGLRRLSAEQSSDLYEVILERHRRASTIVTSNRTIDEWIPLFDDPILAQSALDRLAHNAYQVVMEGESFRKRQRPGERQDDRPAPKPRSRRRRVA